MKLQFDNRFLAELPGDPETDNVCRQVANACWSRVAPTAVAKPTLGAISAEVAAAIGIDQAGWESPLFAQVFGGNGLLPGMDPYAVRYGGHQFGNWAGQLGDGRAITLGEVVHEESRWVLQLKVAGPTPYSRHADGRAVLRSSIREFLCSEAMHHLGVPTTRALSLVLTGDEILRDMFYDGHPKMEPGAIVCRAAPSFIRFGNFEILAARRETELLEQLVMFTIRRDFPELGEPDRSVVPAWLMDVARRTAEMVIHWMRVGFVHGVMNTDNMSILGLTIDYGPYGWLEDYDPNWTPNTTDAMGKRYRYGAQPDVAAWNLRALLQAVLPLLGSVEEAQSVLDSYIGLVQTGLGRMMADKLGIDALEGEDDQALVNDLWVLLGQAETDMTIFHRALAQVPVTGATDDALLGPLLAAHYSPDGLTPEHRAATLAWVRRYTARVRQVGIPDAQRRAAMDAVNPKYVLRNYLAQQAIDKAEEGDFSLVHEVLDVMRHPYDEQPGREAYAEKRPEWARDRPGCSMLSCSS